MYSKCEVQCIEGSVFTSLDSLEFGCKSPRSLLQVLFFLLPSHPLSSLSPFPPPKVPRALSARGTEGGFDF